MMMAMGLAACSSDPTDHGGTSGAKTVTLDIPIDIYSSQEQTVSRAASQGDPGTTEDFKAPLYLYIYAYVKDGSTGGYELLKQTLTYKDDTEAASAWTLQDQGTTSERWHKSARVTFNLSADFVDELGSSRVYAIASRKDLSGLLTDDVVKNFTSLKNINATTLDLSSFASGELKDIYSTPANDHSTPYQSSDNGLIVGADGTLTCSPVKLYHVAAKVDFTWEVATSLQQTTELASITCTGLPTTCKIFEPTNNPTSATADCLVLGSAGDGAVGTPAPTTEVNTGNKWLGRAYAYVLQPSSGAINYTVTYGGSAGKAATTATFTPASLNSTFTGWYRIIATVK